MAIVRLDRTLLDVEHVICDPRLHVTYPNGIALVLTSYYLAAGYLTLAALFILLFIYIMKTKRCNQCCEMVEDLSLGLMALGILEEQMTTRLDDSQEELSTKSSSEGTPEKEEEDEDPTHHLQETPILADASLESPTKTEIEENPAPLLRMGTGCQQDTSLVSNRIHHPRMEILYYLNDVLAYLGPGAKSWKVWQLWMNATTQMNVPRAQDRALGVVRVSKNMRRYFPDFHRMGLPAYLQPGPDGWKRWGYYRDGTLQAHPLMRSRHQAGI